MRAIALGALLVVNLAAAADAPPPDPQPVPSNTFSPLDVFKLEWADHPQLSPDGKRVVYQRMRFDIMKDRKRSQLWLVDAEGRGQRALLADSNDQRDAQWSPDGRRIAYIAASEGKAQIHVLWLDSGAGSAITHLTEGPGNLSWSPDGRWIAFTQRVPAQDPPLAKLPPAPKGAEWAEPAKLIDRLMYRIDGGGYIDPGYSHVFVVSADGGPARQITSGKHDFAGPVAWARDGKSVFVSTNLNDDWEHQPLESELYRVDVDNGALTKLTDRKGPDRNAVISPDGRTLAYLGFDDKGHPYQAVHLYALDLTSGKSHAVTADTDVSVEEPVWDGNASLYFSYDERGTTRVGHVGLGGGKVETVADDVGGTEIGRPYTSGSISGAAGRVAYTRDALAHAADVGIVARGSKPRSLTDLSSNLLDHKTLGGVEEINVKSSADGRAIQAWVVRPPRFDPKKSYPLLLEIHGGPFAAYGPHFAPETQLYAAQGYVVVYANPRGSTSYGTEFANLIENAYPSQDYDDLISVVDAVIARGSIDTNNLFVTGGSGGGVLTAWIVGHTDRFRAAVVAKPVINWYSFVLTSDFYQLFAKYWFPGVPWENAEHYLKRSPIAYVGNVKTPTMLITGDADHRTPSSEAEQFYQALKLRGVDTAMLRIPGASHEINTRPSNMLDQVLYTIGWFEKHRASAEKK